MLPLATATFAAAERPVMVRWLLLSMNQLLYYKKHRPDVLRALSRECQARC